MHILVQVDATNVVAPNVFPHLVFFVNTTNIETVMYSHRNLYMTKLHYASLRDELVGPKTQVNRVIG